MRDSTIEMLCKKLSAFYVPTVLGSRLSDDVDWPICLSVFIHIIIMHTHSYVRRASERRVRLHDTCSIFMAHFCVLRSFHFDVFICLRFAFLQDLYCSYFRLRLAAYKRVRTRTDAAHTKAETQIACNWSKRRRRKNEAEHSRHSASIFKCRKFQYDFVAAAVLMIRTERQKTAVNGNWRILCNSRRIVHANAWPTALYCEIASIEMVNNRCRRIRHILEFGIVIYGCVSIDR